jgi:hypothetical protein
MASLGSTAAFEGFVFSAFPSLSVPFFALSGEALDRGSCAGLPDRVAALETPEFPRRDLRIFYFIRYL